jgi:LAO/AO transport system kinase
MAQHLPDISRLTQGDRTAVARAISLVENEEPGAQDLLKELFPFTGRCHRIGITGPPGAGKSTITNRLAQEYRRRGLEVGIIAVDPTSPFTGGALLGDRVRMADVEMDPGVFIRSMASRGSLGGLSRKAIEAADILDASGKNIVILETVGVGQSELDIAGAADTTVVVLVPESGDSIQAMKAGLMEIADLFVLNKSDRAGADQAVLAIQMILHFRKTQGWKPEILKTVAHEGTGVSDVVARIAAHRTALEALGGIAEKRRQRAERRIRDLVMEQIHISFWDERRTLLLNDLLDDVLQRKTTPYQAALNLLAGFRSSRPAGEGELPS